MTHITMQITVKHILKESPCSGWICELIVEPQGGSGASEFTVISSHKVALRSTSSLVVEMHLGVAIVFFLME